MRSWIAGGVSDNDMLGTIAAHPKQDQRPCISFTARFNSQERLNLPKGLPARQIEGRAIDRAYR
jgi:hypothetical protein